jgi:hypothetical protein
MNRKDLDAFESQPIEEQLKQHKDEYYVSMTPEAIPTKDEMTKLLLDIEEMIALIEDPKMKELKNTDEAQYKNEIYHRYNQCVPMKVIGLMLEDERYEHLDKLLDMFSTLNEIKAGKKNMTEEFDKFKDNLNDEYLYKPHGGKTEFEKKFTKKN